MLPPTQVDSYQLAQAVSALAGFGALTAADWRSFESDVAGSLERELVEGYTGPHSLAAQQVRASVAADKEFSDPRVIKLLEGVARTPADQDIYDRVAATEVQRWVSDKSGSVSGGLTPAFVRKKTQKAGCIGTEALFLLAALERVSAGNDTACDQAQKDDLVDAELEKLSSADPEGLLPSDQALILRAAGALARTPSQASEIQELKTDFVARLNAADVTDPLTVAYALSEVPGDAALGSDATAFLRVILQQGGAPVTLKLSGAAAATVARTLDVAGSQVPPELLAVSADLPLEARARIMLILGAEDTQVEQLVAQAGPFDPDAQATVTAVFQLLLRHGAPLCSQLASPARHVAADERSPLTSRAVSNRYLQQCGQVEEDLARQLRSAWEAAHDNDVRSAFQRQSVACALRLGLTPPQQSWRRLGQSVAREGGVEDESGELDVTQTHMMTLLLADQDEACRDGVYW